MQFVFEVRRLAFCMIISVHHVKRAPRVPRLPSARLSKTCANIGMATGRFNNANPRVVQVAGLAALVLYMGGGYSANRLSCGALMWSVPLSSQ